MHYLIIVGVLLAISVLWLVARAFTDRSYVKGKGVRNAHSRKKPKKWELKSDGHIEAEEAVYADQMRTRYAYYKEFEKNPPLIRRLGDTIIASDDFEAAQGVIDKFSALAAASAAKPLGALVVIREFNYRNVWYLHGLSDLTKSAIFQQAQGKTVYMPDYRVLVALPGDIEGLKREFALHESLNS